MRGAFVVRQRVAVCEIASQVAGQFGPRTDPNREDAEDAVQDSLLNAFVHLKDFDGRSQFATWLMPFRLCKKVKAERIFQNAIRLAH